MKRVSQPVGVGTGIFAGFMFGGLIAGDDVVPALVTAVLAGIAAFGVSFAINARRARDEDA